MGNIVIGTDTEPTQVQTEEFRRDQADQFWLATRAFTEEASSDGLGWRNAHLLMGVAGPGPFGPRRLRHPSLSFAMDPDRRVDTALASGQLLRLGCMTCSPEGTVGHGRLGKALRLLILTFRGPLIDELGRELCGDDAPRVQLLHQYDVADRCILDLAHSLASVAVSRDLAASGYADALLRAIAARLVYRHSSNSGFFSQSHPVRLLDDATERERLQADEMQAVKSHVRRHIDQRLLVEDLARLCDRSSAHFSRLLKRSTGLSPHQYVLSSRISEAKRLLAGSNVPIAEVAARCGFSSQEHLSRRFREATGSTPGAFRKL